MAKDYYIKNMVCDRCIKVLRDEVQRASIGLKEIELGRLKLDIDNEEQLQKFKGILKQNGFELIVSTEEKLTEDVKIELLKILNTLPVNLDVKLSDYLADTLAQDYSKISKVFSFTEGKTIEKYYIKLKIEKVKELIQAQEKNFTEISQLLNYTNINHLSRQFKAQTGLSLTQYKTEQKNFRNPLDQIV